MNEMQFFIESASIDVTYKCNLRCKHCFNFAGENTRDEINDSTLSDIFTALSEYEMNSICLCGGEPLLRLNSVLNGLRILKKGNPLGKIAMVSNGILWNQSIADSLKVAGLDLVQFSLDGLKDISYDFVRQSKGKLYKVFDAINYAKNSGITVVISTIPHKKNYTEFQDLINVCDELGVSELRVQPLMKLGRGESNYVQLSLTPKENESIATLLALRSNTVNTRLIWGDPIDHFYMYRELKYVPQICINAYGEIVLSPYLPITIWNLRKYTLADYFNLNIPVYALKHKKICNLISKIYDISDFTSHYKDMPLLFLESNLDLSEELREMATHE